MLSNIGAFLRFMHDGGPVNYVIALLYVLVLAVFSERLIYFIRTRYRRDSVFENISSLGPAALQAGHASFTWPYTRSQPVRIIRCFVQNGTKPARVLSENLDREGLLLKSEMERGLPVLSFIGTTAPLVGLLGTITGLMNTFSQIESRGSSVDISYLSGGIREAMITTATGLVTALCAIACCKYFERLAECRLRDMTLCVSILGEHLRQDILTAVKEEDKESA
jgi:biopolymer transport protein ExbB